LRLGQPRAGEGGWRPVGITIQGLQNSSRREPPPDAADMEENDLE
jgi:hypothetical protein